MRTKAEIFEMIEEEGVEFIRLQFTDMFGKLKNVAVTVNGLEEVFKYQYVFNGQDAFGFDEPKELYLRPDLDTFVILPWRPQQGKVARMICDVCDENDNEYSMSPRKILKDVVEKAKEQGYTFTVEPECEFFLFHTDENGLPTTVTHEKAGYMDVGPVDFGENARREMVLNLEEMGFYVKSSHHEKAAAQHEIDFREADPLVTADSIVTLKNAIRSIAKRFGLHATFMPKPKAGEPGSGMHLNITCHKGSKNIFEDGADGEMAVKFIGGIKNRLGALCAITNPLVNSYKRCPKELVRVKKQKGQEAKLELRFPDSASNPYLAIALCIIAGLEGIKENAADVQVKIPRDLKDAVLTFDKDALMNDLLGKEFVKNYVHTKMREWNQFMEQISEWEINNYLYRV